MRLRHCFHHPLAVFEDRMRELLLRKVGVIEAVARRIASVAVAQP
jgi:hypothetical protein